MAKKDSTKKPDLNQVLQGLDNPERLNLLIGFVEVLVAAKEGRLSPKGLEKLDELKDMIKEMHRQYFGN